MYYGCPCKEKECSTLLPTYHTQDEFTKSGKRYGPKDYFFFYINIIQILQNSLPIYITEILQNQATHLYYLDFTKLGYPFIFSRFYKIRYPFIFSRFYKIRYPIIFTKFYKIRYPIILSRFYKIRYPFIIIPYNV